MADGKLTFFKNCDPMFLASLFRRFDERKDFVSILMNFFSFGYSVKKALWISQPKYVSYAVKYYPYPFNKSSSSSDDAYLVMRSLNHLRRIGIRKLLDGRCIYVIFDGEEYLVKSNIDYRIAERSHTREFVITDGFIKSLIAELGFSEIVYKFYSQLGLVGGSRVPYRILPVCGVAGIGRNFIASTRLVVGKNYQKHVYPCIEKHYNNKFPSVIGLKVFVEFCLVKKEMGQYMVIVEDEKKGEVVYLKKKCFNGQSFSHSLTVNLEKWVGNHDLICRVIANDFDGAVRCEFKHKVAFFDSSTYSGYDFFHDNQCECEEPPYLESASKLLAKKFQDFCSVSNLQSPSLQAVIVPIEMEPVFERDLKYGDCACDMKFDEYKHSALVHNVYCPVHGKIPVRLSEILTLYRPDSMRDRGVFSADVVRILFSHTEAGEVIGPGFITYDINRDGVSVFFRDREFKIPW